MHETPLRRDFVEYRSVVGPARSVEMKHLITGGSGFIGNLTARRLRERGDGVRLLDIWADPSRPKDIRSEEHTSELQSLMRISYAVFCLKKKTTIHPLLLPSSLTSMYCDMYCV